MKERERCIWKELSNRYDEIDLTEVRNIVEMSDESSKTYPFVL